MDGQQFCLKWDSFQSSVTSLLDRLWQGEELVDITLCCEGQSVRAHRVVLSACSPYFRDLLRSTPCQQLVFFLKETSAQDLRAIVEFMYKGSVNVAQSQLASFIKTAEMLQIRGLSGDEQGEVRQASPRPAGLRPSNSVLSGGASPQAPSPKRRSLSSSSAVSDVRPPVTSHAGSAGSRLTSPTRPGQDLSSLAGHQQELPAVKRETEVELTEEQVKTEVDLTPEPAFSADPQMALSAGPSPFSLPGSPAVPRQGPAVSQGNCREYNGSNSGTLHPCHVCGKVYKYRISLLAHLKHHEGRTVCSVCGVTSSTVQNLRQHLRFVHRLSGEEVARVTCLRVPGGRYQAGGATSPRAGSAAAAPSLAAAVSGWSEESRGAERSVAGWYQPA